LADLYFRIFFSRSRVGWCEFSVLVHSPPQIVFPTRDGEHDLAQVPLVATAWVATTQLSGVRLAKFEAPLPHRFIGHDDASLCAIRSSTSRKLSEKWKYSQTA
jgi:hypothetical protein